MVQVYSLSRKLSTAQVDNYGVYAGIPRFDFMFKSDITKLDGVFKLNTIQVLKFFISDTITLFISVSKYWFLIFVFNIGWSLILVSGSFNANYHSPHHIQFFAVLYELAVYGY